ncbi:MAG: ferredoxin-thioredoxin reductase catalytic domain-containing protein [Coriobacteriia bacterium]|nr:ferredoxin-thioredoxin reductase catalytic domain-containing protein [Coriobacteriia bacterium]
MFSRWSEDITKEEFLSMVLPLVEREGFRLTRDVETRDEILDGLIENIKEEGDSFCPCRLKTDDFDENRKLVCPCINFSKEYYASLQKCWCGLFVVDQVEDDEDLFGVVEEAEVFDYPIVRLKNLAPNTPLTFEVNHDHYSLVKDENDELFLLKGLCPHMAAEFSGGFVEEGRLVCPHHAWSFSLQDGSGDHPGPGLTPRPCYVKDGVVYMEVDKRKN